MHWETECSATDMIEALLSAGLPVRCPSVGLSLCVRAYTPWFVGMFMVKLGFSSVFTCHSTAGL